jgi:hypothetical protein
LPCVPPHTSIYTLRDELASEAAGEIVQRPFGDDARQNFS